MTCALVLPQILFLRTLKLHKIRDGERSVGEGSYGNEMTSEEASKVQQVGMWKGLNQELKEAEAWRPVGIRSL